MQTANEQYAKAIPKLEQFKSLIEDGWQFISKLSAISNSYDKADPFYCLLGCFLAVFEKDEVIAVYAVKAYFEEEIDLDDISILPVATPKTSIFAGESPIAAATQLAIALVANTQRRYARPIFDVDNHKALIGFYGNGINATAHVVNVGQPQGSRIFLAYGADDIKSLMYESDDPGISMSLPLFGNSKSLINIEITQAIAAKVWVGGYRDELHYKFGGIHSFDPDLLQHIDAIQPLIHQAQHEDRRVIIIPTYKKSGLHYPRDGSDILTSVTFGLSLTNEELKAKDNVSWVGLIVDTKYHPSFTLHYTDGRINSLAVELLDVIKEYRWQDDSSKLKAYTVQPGRTEHFLTPRAYEHLVFELDKPFCLVIQTDPVRFSPISVDEDDKYPRTSDPEQVVHLITDELTYAKIQAILTHQIDDTPSLTSIHVVHGQVSQYHHSIKRLWGHRLDSITAMFNWLQNREAIGGISFKSIGYLIIDTKAVSRIKKMHNEDLWNDVSDQRFLETFFSYHYYATVHIYDQKIPQIWLVNFETGTWTSIKLK